MKRGSADLALLGGAPEFDRPRYVGVPNIGDRKRLIELLDGALDRRWLSNGGPLVLQFERRIAAMAGVRHCVATCNATAALELTIRAAGLTGEVIVPTFTFAATAHAVRWMGLTPVLCDVDPHTGNIDPEAAAALVGPRTSAILGVHLWGRPCDVAALAAIADRHGLTLLLDAAQAFGARHLGRPVGGFGAAEVFSFHATKLVNTFEGGAVVTDDGALASRVRAMHNFGIVGEDEVALPGTNGKMSEAAAAMGLVSLEALPAVLARNRRRHLRYRSALAGIDGVALQEPDPDSAPSHHYAVVRIDPDRFGLSRDQLMAVLRAENVVARRYFYPGCHRMAPYSAPDHSFPHADALSASLLALPTGASVDGADIDRIAAIIAVAGAHARTVSAAAAHPRPASALSTVAPDGEPAESGQPRGDGA